MTFALVTGSAKRIGIRIATHLAKSGYNIIIHYNTSEKEAYEAAEEIKNLGADVKLCKANLATASGIKYLQKFCEGLNISLLINNASVFKNDSALSDDIAISLNEHLQVNLISKVAIIQSIAKSSLLNNNNKLYIINVLDYGLFKIPHNFFSYHLTNKILHSFTQLSAKQLLPNVRVNSIALGQTMKNDMQLQENFDAAVRSNPLGCQSTLEEIMKTIDFILSISSMTGQVICLDGGMHLSDNQYR
jgi:NAD(P)-dependent dehydrogenase (short-subunit alcohol dehydrogenase family)